MLHTHQNPHTGGVLHLFDHAAEVKRAFFQERSDRLLPIAWNTGDDQLVNIDGVDYTFPQQSVLPLMVNQSFRFTHPEQLIAWQFNRVLKGSWRCWFWVGLFVSDSANLRRALPVVQGAESQIRPLQPEMGFLGVGKSVKCRQTCPKYDPGLPLGNDNRRLPNG